MKVNLPILHGQDSLAENKRRIVSRPEPIQPNELKFEAGLSRGVAHRAAHQCTVDPAAERILLS